MDLQKEIEELKAMILTLTKPIVEPVVNMEEQAEIIEALRKSCYEYNLANHGEAPKK
jgi:hypothetical protein